MNSKCKKALYGILRLLPLVLCISMVLLYLLSDVEITAESIAGYAPEKPLLAAIFLLLMYILKSISVFVPIIVLNIAGGFLFSTPIALLINLLGAALVTVFPYIVGRTSGAQAMERISKKSDRIAQLITRLDGHDFFLCFILRVISCLPGDVVSMFLGARRIPFTTYFTGSMLGIIPGIITATLIGATITEPSSPMFWISVTLTLLLSLGSITGYLIWEHRKRRENK